MQKKIVGLPNKITNFIHNWFFVQRNLFISPFTSLNDMNSKGFLPLIIIMIIIGIVLLGGGWIFLGGGSAIAPIVSGGGSGGGGGNSVASNQTACRDFQAWINPGNLDEAKNGSVCAKALEASVWNQLKGNLSSEVREQIENGFGNDSLFSFNCSSYDAGPQFALLRECKGETGTSGESKFCEQTNNTADCLETTAQVQDPLAAQCAQLSAQKFGQTEFDFSTCGSGEQKDTVLNVHCETGNAIPSPLGNWSAGVTQGRNCADTGNACTTSGFSADCAASECTTFDGESGFTGSDAAPAIDGLLSAGKWSKPLDYYDPVGGAQFADAYSAIVWSIKTLETARDLYFADQTGNREIYENLLKNQHILLVPDNFEGAAHDFAFTYKNNSPFFQAIPTKYTPQGNEAVPWLNLLNPDESNPDGTVSQRRILHFDAGEVTQAGEYQAEFVFNKKPEFANSSNVEIFINVQEEDETGLHSTVKAIHRPGDGIMVKFKKVTKPAANLSSLKYANPLAQPYNVGLHSVNDGTFGVKFQADSDPQFAAMIPITNELNTQMFSTGSKTIQTKVLSSFSFAQGGTQLAAFPDKFWFSPHGLITVALTATGKNTVGYYFVKDGSTRIVGPDQSPMPNWQIVASKTTCDNLPQDATGSALADCESPGNPGWQINVPEGQFATARMFYPFGFTITMSACTPQDQVATTAGKQTALFDLPQTTHTIASLVQGVKDTAICVVQVKNDETGEPTGEIRFALNAKKFENEPQEAVKKLDDTVSLCIAPRKAPFCEPLNLDAFEGIEGATIDRATLTNTARTLLNGASEDDKDIVTAVYIDQFEDGRLSETHQNELVSRLFTKNDKERAFIAAKALKPGMNLQSCDPNVPDHHELDAYCQGIFDSEWTRVGFNPDAALDQAALDWLTLPFIENAGNGGSARGLIVHSVSGSGTIPISVQADLVNWLKNHNAVDTATGFATKLCETLVKPAV